MEGLTPPQRGEIWWSDLGPVLGSASAGRRPVLVVSADGFNESRQRTVIVAALTTNVTHGHRPGNVHVVAGTAGLERDSVVLVSHLRTVDKRTMVQRCGRLSRTRMGQIDAGLRLVLDLAS